MTKMTDNTKLILKYLEEYDDNVPNLTISKIIFAENPTLFKNIEVIRSTVRTYRGCHGKQRAANTVNKSFFREPRKAGFYVPRPESKDYSPHVLTTKQNNIGIISDLHIPNHRVEPIKIAIEYFHEKKVNTIVINGDLMDNTPFTRHGGLRPSAEDTKRWFDMTERFLESLRDEFPTCEILWTEGNHDAWMSRWMYDHAWMFSKDNYFTLESRLHLDEHDIKFIPQTRYIQAGKLVIVHGHHIVKGIIAPVNAARGVFMKAKVPTIIGHVHVTSEHTETDLHGNINTCWSTGCTCTLTPEYQPMAGKACHGFAHVLVEPNGNFNVSNIRIYKGKIL